MTRAIEAAIARHHLQDTALVDLDRAQSAAGQHRGYPLPIDAAAPPPDAYLGAQPPPPLLPSPHHVPRGHGDWYVDLGQFKSENNARRLVAMLTHQGPPIPARRVARNSQYQVLAGPYPTRAAAAAAAKRIASDLGEAGKPVRFAQTMAQRNEPPATVPQARPGRTITD